MTRRRTGGGSLVERLAFLEAWSDSVDKWREEKEALDTQRHHENQRALEGINDTLKDRDLVAVGHERERMERLAGIDKKLQSIALQTARKAGAQGVWSKIFSAIGQFVLAAVSGGVLMEFGQRVIAAIRGR